MKSLLGTLNPAVLANLAKDFDNWASNSTYREQRAKMPICKSDGTQVLLPYPEASYDEAAVEAEASQKAFAPKFLT